MFNIGDLIVYSSRGICCVDDICEKTFFGVTKNYYVLYPIEDSKLRISISVDNDKVTMLELLTKEEAEEIIESFKLPGIDWIEPDSERYEIYSNIVKKGNRKEISKIANTFMREKIKMKNDGNKFYEKDKKLLTTIQNILFAELAFSLNTTFEVIYEKIRSLINKNEY